MTGDKTVAASILIPVFNREHLVGRTIESALNQTFDDFEVVLVDNASTDNTWEICQKYSAADDRIKLFRNETNIGMVKNWLACLDKSRGHFSCFLYSDDELYPDFLKRTIPSFTGEIGLVFCPARIGTSHEKGTLHYQWKEKDSIRPSFEFIEDQLKPGGLHLVSPVCGIFRTRDLIKNTLTEIPSPSLDSFHLHGAGIDQLIYLLTALDYPKVAFISEPLVFLRAHADSYTISDPEGDLWQRYEQGRIWFSENHLKNNRKILDKLLCKVWLQTILYNHRWAWPSSVFSRYSFNPHRLNVPVTVSETVKFFFRRLKRPVLFHRT